MTTLKKFYRCSCYLTDNIFLSTLKTHIRFISKEQFYSDYEDLLKEMNANEIEKILNEISIEQQRRINIESDSFKRQEIIKAKYVPKYPEIFNFKVFEIKTLK